MFDRSSNTPNLENVYGLMRLEMSDRSKKKKTFCFGHFQELLLVQSYISALGTVCCNRGKFVTSVTGRASRSLIGSALLGKELYRI